LVHLPGGLSGRRHLLPFSTASRGKPVQCDSAAHLLFHYFHSLAVSNYYRNHDVIGTGCSVPLVSQNPRRPASGAQLHFIALIVFSAFIIVHISLIITHGFERDMAKTVLSAQAHSRPLAVIIRLRARATAR